MVKEDLVVMKMNLKTQDFWKIVGNECNFSYNKTTIFQTF